MRIDVQLLGEFAVAVSGVRIARERWRNVRAAQLVQLLALAKGHRLRREQVIDAFWPDLSPAAGAANLRKAAHLARHVLGFEDAVVLAGGDASLAPGSDVRVDTDAFSAAAIDALSSGAPGACAAAARLYTGVLLPDAVYQPWSDEPRLRLRQLYVDLLRAGRQWERLAAEEPTDEQAHRELMRRDLADGNRASALRWYARLESALRLNLGVAPEPDTRRLRDAGVEALPADGDLFVGMGEGQFTNAVGHGGGRPLARTGNLKLSHRFGLPADTQVDGRFPPGQGNIFDQEAEQLLAVGVSGGFCLPQGG